MIKMNLPQPNLKIEDLQPGDVLLFPPNAIFKGGWVGQAIVLITGGKVSHSAVYCGEKNGELKVAHAAPKGITSVSFKALLKAEPGCYVKRCIIKTGLKPVLTAVDGYTDCGNPYPFFNLGVLGLLLLANRFSKKTLRNRIFYDFAILVSVKIMKMIEEKRHQEKKPMSCSQFVAQCYTDAGNEYDIKFNKLIIQFGTFHSAIDEDSLLDMVISENLTNGYEISDLDFEAVLLEEDLIASRFLDLMENEKLEKHELIGKEKLQTYELVDKEKLGEVGQELLIRLCELMTGKQPSSVEEAIELFSTNRNYFVTPDDLLSNAKNLADIGYLDKSVL